MVVQHTFRACYHRKNRFDELHKKKMYMCSPMQNEIEKRWRTNERKKCMWGKNRTKNSSSSSRSVQMDLNKFYLNDDASNMFSLQITIRFVIFGEFAAAAVYFVDLFYFLRGTLQQLGVFFRPPFFPFF